jgi:hypothetical protein
MVKTATLVSDLAAVAEDVARALTHVSTEGDSAFVSTSVKYANGTSAVIRISPIGDGYFVSDDGYAALIADMMGALPTFSKVAPTVAKRFGVEFDHRSFFVMHVQRDQLPAAVSILANVSAVAVERTIWSLEAIKVKRSRILFEERLHEAYGKRVRFGVSVRGATRPWDFDGVVLHGNQVQAVFEFVAPAFNSVATANMKIGDVRSMTDAPYTVAALADYDRTESSLRAVLSNVADRVIPVSTPADGYKLAA